MVVQHNLTAMNSNRMLGLTTKSQAKSTEKLSSGYKINRAADDAAGLAISEKMRRQIRGLTQSSLNAQDGISAVQTAEGALTEVHDMLQRMNELATKAANGTNSSEEREYIQSEVNALIDEIDRVAETTKFNELYLLRGGADGSAEAPAVKKTVTMNDAAKKLGEMTITLKAGAAAVYGAGEKDAVTATSAAAAASMALDTTALGANKLFVSPTGGGTAAADHVEVTDADLATYFDVADDGTVTAKAGISFVTAGNLTIANAGGGTTSTGVDSVTGTAATAATTGTLDQYVELDADGNLKYKDGAMLYDIAAADTPHGAQTPQTGAHQIAEADLGNYFEAKGTPIHAGSATGPALTEETDLSAYFDEFGVYKGGLYLDDGAGNVVEIGAEQVGKYFDFKNADGAGAAAPMLEFRLHVGAEGDLRNTISVEIEAMSAAGIGVDGLRDTGVITQDGARETIETLKGAIKKVSQQRSDLGAVQNRLEHTINNLDNIVENTTSAESQIRDTDMATEMVKYSNNNILAQAGQAMLAQANQSNQGVLSLLG